jgi:PAS domain S-box-containing protein
VFIGLLLAYIGSVDYMPAYGIGVYPFGYIPVCIFGLFITYAIIKYRLMVITPALAADTIINTMADSLIVFGPERNIIFVNPVTCDLLGYTKEELIGEPADMLFSYGNPFRAQGPEQLIKDGSIYNYEMTYLTKNREMIPVSFNSSAIKDKTGNLVGIVGIARDVRDTKRFIENLEKANQELKEAQAQLVQSAKMAAVGQLGAGVAHELNNPLGGILGYAQFILEKFKRPEFSVDDFKSSSRYIESIEREAFRCKGIVENLLKFSRRPISIKPEPLDINQSLHETLSIIGHQLKLKNINLILNLQEDLAKVTGITNQLQQVFTNLILNSQQAMQSGGELKITTQNILDELTKAPTKVRIDFTDTGCGISEENLAHLFEPFFTTKQKEKGTGLGLAVSYQIIQEHKGTLEVTSQVGKGTTVDITLPAILRIR